MNRRVSSACVGDTRISRAVLIFCKCGMETTITINWTSITGSLLLVFLGTMATVAVMTVIYIGARIVKKALGIADDRWDEFVWGKRD